MRCSSSRVVYGLADSRLPLSANQGRPRRLRSHESGAWQRVSFGAFPRSHLSSSFSLISSLPPLAVQRLQACLRRSYVVQFCSPARQDAHASRRANADAGRTNADAGRPRKRDGSRSCAYTKPLPPGRCYTKPSSRRCYTQPTRRSDAKSVSRRRVDELGELELTSSRFFSYRPQEGATPMYPGGGAEYAFLDYKSSTSR